MKNIVIQFYDNNEQFDTFCDSNTTPLLLAQFIQEANYYENFNLSEIFYFKIKDSEYYFAKRNTPICKYLSDIDQPTLIFYRGLTGQQNLKSCTDVESSKNQINDLKVQQQKDILNGKEFSNTQNQNQFEQPSQAKSQQPKQNKIIITEMPYKEHPVIQNKNMNSKSLRENELNLNEIKQIYGQTSNSIMLQKINVKAYHPFDIPSQLSGIVKSEIQGFEPYHRISLKQQPQMLSYQQKNEQINHQQMGSQLKSRQMQQNQNQKNKKSQQKNHYLVCGEQPQNILNYLKNRDIKYKQKI